MISRRSTIAIADAYHAHFTSIFHYSSSHSEFKYKREELYDFLFANNFDAWILNAFRGISMFTQRGLKDFIMKIHTGESLASGTPTWSWENRSVLGQRILKDLAECIIRLRYEDKHFGEFRKWEIDTTDSMIKSLELDGYIYRQGILWVPEETVLQEREEEGVLLGLISSLQFQDPQTLKHHLELSASHYQESRWDDSISNSRKLLEGVLQQTAGRHAHIVGSAPPGQEVLAKPVSVREYLEKVGLLEKKEKEALAHIYGLLSNTGGHPYIAQRDQARLMRHLALTFCQFVLLRLEGAIKQLNP
jgi:hypothetical protein